MADLRVDKTPDNSRQVTHVAPDSGREQSERERQPGDGKRRPAPGAEELAVALTGGGGTAMEALYEEDADGNPLIRIVDVERDETVAVLTPEELKTLTEQTGLPPGLLLHTAS